MRHCIGGIIYDIVTEFDAVFSLVLPVCKIISLTKAFLCIENHSRDQWECGITAPKKQEVRCAWMLQAPLQMLKCIVIVYSGKHKKCKYSEIRGETEEKVGIISVNGNSCLYGTKPGGVVLLLHIYCCNQLLLNMFQYCIIVFSETKLTIIQLCNHFPREIWGSYLLICLNLC